MQEALSAQAATEFDIVKKVEIDVEYAPRPLETKKRRSIKPRLLLDDEKRYP